MLQEYSRRVPERKKCEPTFPCKFSGLWPGLRVTAKAPPGPLPGLTLLAG